MSILKWLGLYYAYTLYANNTDKLSTVSNYATQAKDFITENLAEGVASASELPNTASASVPTTLPDAYINGEVVVPKTAYGLIAKGYLNGYEQSVYVLNNWIDKTKPKPFITVGEYNNLTPEISELYDTNIKKLGDYQYYQVISLKDYNIIRYSAPRSSIGLPEISRSISLTTVPSKLNEANANRDYIDEYFLTNIPSLATPEKMNVLSTVGNSNEINVIIAYTNKVALLKILHSYGIDMVYTTDKSNIDGVNVEYIKIYYDKSDLSNLINKIKDSNLTLSIKIASNIPGVKQPNLWRM